MAPNRSSITVTTRSYKQNPLLARRQMIFEAYHPMMHTPSQMEMRSKLAQMYKTSKDVVSVFGIRTKFGGDMSSGFALIYDSRSSFEKFEPKYRIQRQMNKEDVKKSEKPLRKHRKNKKNRVKYLRGKEKVSGSKKKRQQN
ncbi:hypothetical protein SNEBB_000699 [Seison nebaliae]|nr:hypothetical protein SNEBB_000699 [Seison nebaliae]